MEEFTPNKIEQNIQCVEGTMNLEGLSLSDACKQGLSHYAYGEIAFDDLLKELVNKFTKEVNDEVRHSLEDTND